ncbi:MAG: DUF3187 family protein, partial [Gammaproteobacteria bacterium]|nr:DUF3187 family protein [Gammaproteobacteria bacterium]
LRAQLSLPTGDSAQLRGSGAPELALWLSANKAMRWLALPVGWWGGGGVLLMGNGDVLPEQQRHAALFGSVGVGARVLPWMNLKLQLDFHGPLYDNSGLTQINSPAAQLVIGGDLLLGKNVTLELAVTEDVVVHASPDVVFYLGLSVGD